MKIFIYPFINFFIHLQKGVKNKNSKRKFPYFKVHFIIVKYNIATLSGRNVFLYTMETMESLNKHYQPVGLVEEDKPISNLRTHNFSKSVIKELISLEVWWRPFIVVVVTDFNISQESYLGIGNMLSIRAFTFTSTSIMVDICLIFIAKLRVDEEWPLETLLKDRQFFLTEIYF